MRRQGVSTYLRKRRRVSVRRTWRGTWNDQLKFKKTREKMRKMRNRNRNSFLFLFPDHNGAASQSRTPGNGWEEANCPSNSHGKVLNVFPFSLPLIRFQEHKSCCPKFFESCRSCDRLNIYIHVHVYVYVYAAERMIVAKKKAAFFLGGIILMFRFWNEDDGIIWSCQFKMTVCQIMWPLHTYTAMHGS